MTSIINGLQNLVASVFEIFGGIINTVLSTLQSFLAVFTTLAKDVLQLFQGLINFMLQNIVIIGVLAAAFVGFTVLTQRQNKPIAHKKGL
ncbi:hypothetical protein M501DRAFT_1015481 [Patellaria atrata CBS 101060]|uniref:Uncharacterized protein n=1 Tax=Patellaria atrata CBS 101060 TaxID=1346257 RepID=A0A9P4SD13_9PEZI|nr:hypothetical protein M501DRAFT_1015481 [Patellaria atrata CBS 101060]